MTFSRAGVTVIDEITPSNLLAFRPGIMPSKSLSTHLHLTFSSAQIALPKSISKPTRLPSAAFDSNGA
ncbi:hypothetical protein D3C73_1384130 [compost metagenome]